MRTCFPLVMGLSAGLQRISLRENYAGTPPLPRYTTHRRPWQMVRSLVLPPSPYRLDFIWAKGFAASFLYPLSKPQTTKWALSYRAGSLWCLLAQGFAVACAQTRRRARLLGQSHLRGPA